MSDPQKLIENLDPKALERRLEAIDAERRAVVVLLRAAWARTRRPRRKAREGVSRGK